MHKLTSLFSAFFLYVISFNAHAVPALFDWAFNVDGALSENFAGDTMPVAGALDAQGLGTLTLNVMGGGGHSVLSFFDFEIDEPTNSFFNESGMAVGTPASGQSWEIDEPFLFGDIYTNVTDLGVLDNTNAVPAGSEDDVAFALGWDFTLNASETAVISLNLADMLPAVTPDFYLVHTDAETGPTGSDITNVYFWSSLDIRPTSVPVPEPASLFLLIFGLFIFYTKNGFCLRDR